MVNSAENVKVTLRLKRLTTIFLNFSLKKNGPNLDLNLFTSSIGLISIDTSFQRKWAMTEKALNPVCLIAIGFNN